MIYEPFIGNVGSSGLDMKKIIIVGGGQNGFVIKNILEHDPKNRVVGFLDEQIEGPHVLGKTEEFKKFVPDHHFFVAIGNIQFRREAYELLKRSGAKFVNAIHPEAFVEDSVSLGQNVMVGAFSHINVNSKIGSNVLINNHVNVDHDNVVGDHSDLNPNVATGGGVVIGESTFVGMGTLIRDHITVGDYVVIGMGATVIKDIPDKVRYLDRLNPEIKDISD